MRLAALIGFLAATTACTGPDGTTGTPGSAGQAGAQGVAGPQGLPGTAGLQGPQGLPGAPGARATNWVGGWSDLTRYQVDDAVDHLGSSYVAVTKPVLGQAPPNGDWQLMASVGATGAQGPQGLKGDTGIQGPAGSGSVVLLETGAGLTGGPITASGVISIATAGVSNAMLASSGLTVTAGAGLSGGGAVSLGGSISLAAANLGGDVVGPPGASSVTALQGSPVAATAPADGQFLAFSALQGAWIPATVVVPQVATYRYAVFDTYDQAAGWMGASSNGSGDPSIFGGVTPQAWTDGNAVASQLSADKEVLRTLYGRKGYAGANALVHAETFAFYSSTNGKVVTALFRIRNTTASPITWTPQVRLTCYGAWGEYASIALNGSLAWSSGGATMVATGAPLGLPLSVPPGRTSTVIFVSTGSIPSGQTRSVLLAFVNNSLSLPVGLQFVDDLDTATGGWTQ